MIPSPELSLLHPRAALWHAYDPASKSELYSTAIAGRSGRVLIVDPILLAADARSDLARLGTVNAIAVTNGNHWRAARQFSGEFNVPVFAAPESFSAGQGPMEPADSLPALFDGLTVIPIEGAAPGEIVLHFSDDKGTAIVGDSLIHFEPYGLALLPKKYCSNQDKMRQSLRQLPLLPTSRLFFAHGLPIVNQPSPRLQALLDE